MSSDNFYDILGIGADSQLEDIRKAYKKRALQTHPDRLPQGSTAEDKSLAEENFRSVNNAYEILSDANKRRLYDLYGVWPPPEEVPDVRRSDTFDSHYDRSRPHPSFHHQFGFRDPFELFNSFFPELHQAHFGGIPPGPSPFNNRPFFTPMFHPMGQPSMFMDPFGSRPPTMNMFHNFPPPDANARTFSFQSSSQNFQSSGFGGNGNWISESTSTRTINGVTETVRKQVDHQGNEHVRRTYPDGREKYTINGVEQPAQGYIPIAPPLGQLPPPEENTGYIPPQQSGDTSDNRSRRHWWGRH